MHTNDEWIVVIVGTDAWLAPYALLSTNMPTIIHRFVVLAILIAGFVLAQFFPREPSQDQSEKIASDELRPNSWSDGFALAAMSEYSGSPQNPAPIETWQTFLPSQSSPSPDAMTVAESASGAGTIQVPQQRSVPQERRALPPISDSTSSGTDKSIRKKTMDGKIRNLPSIKDTPKNPPVSKMRKRPRGRLTTHRISDGDDLKRISGRYLNDESRYMEIYELNRQVLYRPDLLPLGVEIQVYDERD